MKAVILAAGRGKRMGQLTDDTPKPLLKIGTKTLLDNLLSVLLSEISDVIIVIGYQGDKIRQHCGNSRNGKRIHYVEQKELDGTANAFLLTKPFFKEGERFVLLYGDEMLSKEQMAECLSHEFSWLCRRMNDPSQSGVATLDGSGCISAVIEKPKNPTSNIVAAGVMVVNSDLFKYQPVQHTNGEYYITSMLDAFIKEHAVYAVMGTDNLAFSYAEDIINFKIE
jgi:bifunctional UDP-N-acetylglucosamine pyrophosphorylase/glucosamine-1-phosphate N-acetyltransferase